MLLTMYPFPVVVFVFDTCAPSLEMFNFFAVQICTRTLRQHAFIRLSKSFHRRPLFSSPPRRASDSVPMKSSVKTIFRPSKVFVYCRLHGIIVFIFLTTYVLYSFHIVVILSARSGKYVQGHVRPATKGVLLTMISVASGASITTAFSDVNGFYYLGPVDPSEDVKVEAKAEGFHVVQADEVNKDDNVMDFKVVKLSGVNVKVR